MNRVFLGLMVTLAANVVFAQTGTIEGIVQLPKRELEEPKSTPQYPGQPGSQVPYPSTPIPAIVYLRGTVEGRTFTPPAHHPTLSQKDAWFIPEVMAVLVGTTVDFPNLDAQYHNVFSYSNPKQFDLGRYPTGESRSVTFDKPGLVKVFCTIHSQMRAFILVSENPYFAVTDTHGAFRIPDVPAGRHALRVWRAKGLELQREVEVVAGESLKLDLK